DAVPLSSSELPPANGQAGAEYRCPTAEALPDEAPGIRVEESSEAPVVIGSQGIAPVSSNEPPPINGRASSKGITHPPAPPPPSTPSPPATPTPLPPRRKLRSRASRLDFELSRIPSSPPRIDGDWTASPEVVRDDARRQAALILPRTRDRYRNLRRYWPGDEQEWWEDADGYVSGGLGDGACDGKCGVQGMV
ncbi:hypothetical protein LTR95_013772, partial [Oleoguttula sp. CCFEE 5521]